MSTFNIKDMVKETKRQILLGLLSLKDNVGNSNQRTYVSELTEEECKDAILVLNNEHVQLSLLTEAKLTGAVTTINHLYRLFTTFEPNAGDDEDEKDNNTRVNSLESQLMPKLQFFSGKMEDGYSFLESFKAASNGIPEERKIAAFKVLCGPAKMEQFVSQNFTNWVECEKSFQNNHCVIKQTIEAMDDLRNIKQLESEPIRVYIDKFEANKKFIGQNMSTEAFIEMFLAHSRIGVRLQASRLRDQGLTWEEFLNKVQDIDRMELRPEKEVKKRVAYILEENDEVPVSKKVKESALISEESDIGKEVKELKGLVQQLLRERKEIPVRLSNEEYMKNKCCYKCGEFGHFARNCKSTVKNESGKGFQR
jgi:hypothetical protein